MAAAVLFRDAVGGAVRDGSGDARARMLLVEPTYKADWELPGGAVEADESPFDAARREVTEELALAVLPGRLLVVDWVPPRPGRTEGVMFVYDGGVLGPESVTAIRLPAGELRGWAWCTARERASRVLVYPPAGRRGRDGRTCLAGVSRRGKDRKLATRARQRNHARAVGDRADTVSAASGCTKPRCGGPLSRTVSGAIP